MIGSEFEFLIREASRMDNFCGGDTFIFMVIFVSISLCLFYFYVPDICRCSLLILASLNSASTTFSCGVFSSNIDRISHPVDSSFDFKLSRKVLVL